MRLILTASRAYRYAPWGKFNFCIPGISADVRRRRLEVAGVEMGVDKGMLGCRPLFNGLRTFLAALVTGRCVSAAKNIIKTLPLYLHNATTIDRGYKSTSPVESINRFQGGDARRGYDESSINILCVLLLVDLIAGNTVINTG